MSEEKPTLENLAGTLWETAHFKNKRLAIYEIIRLIYPFFKNDPDWEVFNEEER